MLEGRAAIQRGLDRLEEGADRSLMKFNKGQMPSPVHGKEEPLTVRQTEDWLPWEQPQGIMEDSELNMSQQCVLAA